MSKQYDDSVALTQDEANRVFRKLKVQNANKVRINRSIAKLYSHVCDQFVVADHSGGGGGLGWKE